MVNNYSYTIYTLEYLAWLKEKATYHSVVNANLHCYTFKLAAVDGSFLDREIMWRLPEKYLIVGEHIGHLEFRGNLKVSVVFEENTLELWDEANI